MNPYQDLPERAFWRSAVSDRSPLDLADLYQPKFAVTRDLRIAAAGSCFAQHIGSQFKRRGYGFIDLEPPPEGFPASRYQDFGFDLYSARYGNIYTIRQMIQLLARAEGSFLPQEHAFHEADGRVRDPFRPAIEPQGFHDLAEMERDRAHHLSRVALLLAQTDLFVFTFGLTEAWECQTDGAILPACPGTVGGTFDPAKYRFKNFTFREVMEDAETFIRRATATNPAMKFLFTVSPVPLTATASGDHVLSASLYSKSVLRAVCGELRAGFDNVDYFPSYELVASHPMRAMFFMPNLRAVAPEGVQLVMNSFFRAHGDSADAPAGGTQGPNGARDPVCEEEILESFGS